MSRDPRRPSVGAPDDPGATENSTPIATTRGPAATPPAGAPLRIDDAAANELAAELRIHRAELEMPNDELSRTRKALDDSRRDFEQLFDEAPVGYISVDADGRISRINAAGRELLGVNADQLQHCPDLASYVDSGGILGFYDHLERVFTGRELITSEIELIRPDGTSWIAQMMSRKLADPDALRCLMAVTDVSSRHLAEAELRQSEENVRSLFQLAPDAIVALHGGEIVHANERAAEWLGVSGGAQGLKGRRLADFAPDDERDRLDRWIADGTSRMRQPTRAHFRFLALDNAPLHAELAGMPMPYGRRPCFVVLARDLTERRRMQAQMAHLDRMASVGMLVAGVAHEINNPLSFIMPNLELLTAEVETMMRDGVDPRPESQSARLQELVEIAHDALDGAQRVAGIVRDLRAFAVTDVDRKVIDIGKVLERTVRMVRPKLKRRARIDCELRALPKVVANEGRVSQLMVNLLMNAAEAMPERPRQQNRIAVRTWRDGRHACIEVADNGAGIAQDSLPKLFDPFFTTKRTAGGTGLGLAVSNSVVQELGGWIDVDSELGFGARFVVHLLIAGEDDEDADVDAIESLSPIHGLRVLAVDEDPLVLRTLERLMIDRGELVTVRSARAAEHVLQRDGAFDVVLCDPALASDDRPFVAWLGTHRPDLEARVVFLKGLAERGNRDRGPGHDDRPTLEKPFDRAAFDAALRAVISAE